MKALLKPTESFMLMLDRGEVLQSHRPSVVTYTDYIENFVVKGKIKVLEKDLPEEAKDSDFEKFYLESDGNQELSLASYMSSLKPEDKKAKK